MDDLAALVAEARENYTAHYWLHDCSSLERDLLASLAASKHGTQALDFRKDPLLVRKVHAELSKPSVLPGVGTCPECQGELEDDGYCPKGCNHDAMYPDQPRAERPFAKRWG